MTHTTTVPAHHSGQTRPKAATALRNAAESQGFFTKTAPVIASTVPAMSFSELGRIVMNVTI